MRSAIAVVMLLLLVWALWIASGALLYDQHRGGWKSLIIAGSMLLFLGAWLALLSLRAARLRRRADERANSSEGPAKPT